MTASIDWFNVWCDHCQRQQWIYYVTASWVSYHIHTTRDDHPPCAESRFSRHNIIYNSTASRSNRQNKKRYPGGLAQAVKGVLYSAVANRPQPNLYIGGGTGGGCTGVMHGRNRVTIDPRLPTLTIPGRSTSGFHRPSRYCSHQARSTVSCWASRMKGELHPL